MSRNLKRRTPSVLQALLVVSTVGLSACTSKIDEPERNPNETRTSAGSALNVPAELRAISITLPSRSSDQVKQSAAALFRVFAGGAQIQSSEIASARMPGSGPEVLALGAPQRFPSVRVQYYSSTDTFELNDVELARVRDGVEVSESQAKGRAETVLQSLVASAIVAGDDYSLADAQISRVVQGIGHSSGGPPVESTKEYRFFVPRKLDGIVLNDGGHRDLGLKIMIHRSGALKGLKISGLGVNVASAPGVIPRRLDSGTLDARVRTEFPSSEITPLGLRYSLGAKGGEPRQVYKVSRQSMVDGHLVKSRAVMVYYSVADGSTPPETWPKPNPDDVSSRP
jgi:hypothetical protein